MFVRIKPTDNESVEVVETKSDKLQVVQLLPLKIK